MEVDFQKLTKGRLTQVDQNFKVDSTQLLPNQLDSTSTKKSWLNLGSLSYFHGNIGFSGLKKPKTFKSTSNLARIECCLLVKIKFLNRFHDKIFVLDSDQDTSLLRKDSTFIFILEKDERSLNS